MPPSTATGSCSSLVAKRAAFSLAQDMAAVTVQAGPQQQQRRNAFTSAVSNIMTLRVGGVRRNGRNHGTLAPSSSFSRRAMAASLPSSSLIVVSSTANSQQQEQQQKQHSSWKALALGATAAMLTASVIPQLRKQRQQKQPIRTKPTSHFTEPQKQSTGSNNVNIIANNHNHKYQIDWRIPALGRGSFGSVHLAYDGKTGEAVALKRLTKHQTNPVAFAREVDALQQIQLHQGHANVLNLRDLYEDDEYYYLAMDLARGGEVFEDLVQNGPYSEAEAARLIHQLASAMNFLHKDVGILHADIKPENLLLKEKNTRSDVVLVDFGCAVSNCSGSSRTSSGTAAYWPPERFDKKKRVTPSMEMWSVGLILYILLTNTHPFDTTGTATDEEIQASVCASRRAPLLPDHTLTDGSGAQDVLNRLLARNPRKRMTCSELLQHPWIRKHVHSSSRSKAKVAAPAASASVLLAAVI